MEVPPFGEIEPSAPDEYYEGEISIDGKQINIDVNFESEAINESELETLSGYIKNIENESKKACEAIAKDWDLGEASETARFYLEHHMNEFTDDEIISVFGKSEIDKETYLNALKLVRIGLYPEDEESFAIFDIQLPEEYTNYLMAVTFNREGELSYISMDS